MRRFLMTMAVLAAAPALAADLAADFEGLGTIQASVEGETYDLQAFRDPSGHPSAFQVAGGGPVSVTVDAMAVNDDGNPIPPRVIVSLIMMGPVKIAQSVQYHEPGNTSQSEIWMAEDGLGDIQVIEAELSEDGTFTGTLDATLHRVQVTGAPVDGHAPISLTATISSKVPEIAN